ncbi:hypothetical protein PHYC_03469 [Phycisphaerales bacterium]|nr:hypothetical protein PHYC_03469 [Phycisphaerales bacterium]
MNTFLIAAGGTVGAMLLGAWALQLIARLGAPGRGVAEAFTRAPWLDLPITYFTVLPLIVGPVWGGWLGLAGAVAGQVVSVLVWCWLHELANLEAVRGPRIVRSLNRIVGRWRNHAAVWATGVVLPVFWIVRMAQIFIYPLLSLLIGLPRYKHGEWVSVSRHKFSGLVGHDLVWCLYCDWMTGVWSLGTEMLRNVESFWCPIRFYDGKKCENCKIDFPDIDGGWVKAEGTMAEVVAVVEEKHSGNHHGWFGHPTRVTVKGKDIAAK